MGKYRKIDPRIWNDRKFMGLSDSGKLVFLFLLTHPHMTALGAMRASIPGLASELNWQEKAFLEAFGEASAKGMIKHDKKASFLWLPNFIKYNRPESPNVVKAWVAALDLLPECDLLRSLIQHVKAFVQGLHKGFAEALPEDFGKALLIQEQEQEQEQENIYCAIDRTTLENTSENLSETGEEGNSEPTYLSKRKRLLNGKKLVAFEDFWKVFDDKRSRAEAADAFLDVYTKEIHADIIAGARRYASERSSLKKKGLTPKMAQGWLSARRWEDEPQMPDQKDVPEYMQGAI